MKEGWYNDDYLILFEGSEAEDKERDYEIDRLLPGHRLLGMVGWDYFLVMNRENQRVFRVPTIPLILKEKEEWPHKVDLAALKPDERFQGKVKWYLKPVVFGGDPNPGGNLVWISHENHVQGVKYWNQMYLQAVRKP
jgi:hypothetical protein